MAFSPDGAWLATGGADGDVRIWQRGSDGTFTQTVVFAVGSEVNGLAFDPNGVRVLVASVDGVARVIQASDGVLVARLERHEGPILSASFDAAGDAVVTASADHTLRIFSLEPSALIALAKSRTRRELSDEERRRFRFETSP